MTEGPRSAEFYRSLLERGSELVLRVRLEPERELEYISPALAALLGLSRAECHADLTRVEALVFGEDRPLLALFDPALEPSPQPFELRFIDADGKPCWTSARQWRSREGEAQIFELIARNIGERKSLIAERDFAERLLDTAHAIVLVLDLDAKIVFFNPYMRDLCGYELDEVRGQDWFSTFVVDEDRGRLETLFEKAVDDLEVVGNINAISTKTGERRQIEWYAKTLHDNEGAIVGLINVGWDITDKLELELELARTQRLATIGTMASMFAHEVGNPLNGMYLQVQMLERRLAKAREGHPGQPLEPRVEAIKHEILRLSALLTEFRNFQRPQQLALQPTNICALLEDLLARQVRPVAPSGITVEAEIDAVLPQIQANANKLEQVFLNLCKNAIEAMPEGGTLVLRARVDEQRGRVLIEVTDTGTGIPEDLDVFEPFRTTKAHGTGLGLPLVRELVRAHGGEVHYTSELGSGTCFTVELCMP